MVTYLSFFRLSFFSEIGVKQISSKSSLPRTQDTNCSNQRIARIAKLKHYGSSEYYISCDNQFQIKSISFKVERNLIAKGESLEHQRLCYCEYQVRAR